ncbi:unnamed protein product, partial [Pylaiella littoralis]
MDSLFVQEECDDALKNTRPIKSMLLISDEISTETLERTVKKAHGELEL